jgi:hypothetical protein
MNEDGSSVDLFPFVVKMDKHLILWVPDPQHMLQHGPLCLYVSKTEMLWNILFFRLESGEYIFFAKEIIGLNVADL